MAARPSLAALFLVLTLTFAACVGNGEDGSSSSSASSTASGVTVPADAKCGVLRTLSDRCWSCHATKIHPDATVSLVTSADLQAASDVDPRNSNARRSVLRMRDTKDPMPPDGGTSVPQAEIDAFEAWLDAGAPEADCGELALDPYAAKPSCSGTQLMINQQESEEMNPGRSCNTCHEQVNAEQGGDSPIYRIAGTLFPTAHEPDDCLNEIPGGVTVDIIDANGAVTTLPVNAAGNFFSDDHTIAFPYRAIVRFQGGEREMFLPQENGSCNECHTQAGMEDAPGRVLLPLPRD